MLTACGGSDTPDTTNDTTYSLDKLLSTSEGVVFDENISGSDSNGSGFGGYINITNTPQVLYKKSFLTTPRDMEVLLVGSKDEIVKIENIRYIDESGNLVSLELPLIEGSCTPAEPDYLPETITSGDSGTLSTLTCNSSDTWERSWRAVDAGNENISLVTTVTVKDSINQIISITEDEFILDTTGNIQRFSSLLIRGDYTLNYSTDPNAAVTPVNNL